MCLFFFLFIQDSVSTFDLNLLSQQGQSRIGQITKETSKLPRLMRKMLKIRREHISLPQDPEFSVTSEEVYIFKLFKFNNLVYQK